MASSPRADWEAAALKALRGAPLESLVTTTLDGIDIAPLYTSETSAPVNTGERPGQAAYGQTQKRQDKRILQRSVRPDPVRARCQEQR